VGGSIGFECTSCNGAAWCKEMLCPLESENKGNITCCAFTHANIYSIVQRNPVKSLCQILIQTVDVLNTEIISGMLQDIIK
jgi:hypothetical protein